MKEKRAMPIHKNEIVPLTITGVTTEGLGVGRYEGIAVFVPSAAPGDELEVHIVKVLKNHAFGKISKIIKPAETRIEPDCPVFAQCGGCCYRHISYEEELRLKEERVRDALGRIGGFADLPMRPICGTEERNGYRNKALLPLGLDKDGKLTMGFYALNSHRIVDCDDCKLQPEVFTKAAQAVRRWFEISGETVYDEQAHKGKLRRLYLRYGKASGEVLACLVINGESVRHSERLVDELRRSVPGLVSVLLNENREKTNVALGKKTTVLWGKPHLTDTLCGLEFQLSPLSFYQVNHDQTERLYALAAEFADLSGKETLLDLYCGVGTIGLTMANKAKKLIGVEIVPDAIVNAKANAERNHIENAEFLCGDAAFAAEKLKERGEHPDVIILDPPRKGCAPELVHTVAEFNPQRVVYVSCDPATLARDCKLFAELGYKPQLAAPVDLFPGTGHMETVCLLSKA